MFQINNTPDGYVVEVYREVGAFYDWAKLANFGDNQGDARFFKEYDAPRLAEWQIRSLIDNYDKSVIFRKLATGHYQKSATTNTARV